MLKILKKTLCAAAAAALLAGCGSDLLPNDEGGSFMGVWDGAPWSGRAYAVLQGDSLFVVGHRPDPKYFYDEYVQAQVRFTGPGTYPITESAGRLAQISGGDAGFFSGAAGTLVIDDYNAATHTVRGNVTLHAASQQFAWDASGAFAAFVYPSFAQVPSTR